MRGESWWDIVNTAAASIGGATGIGRKIQEIVRESTKTVGYVLWDSYDDEYMCILDEKNISWIKTIIVDDPIIVDKFKRFIFTEWEIDYLQKIIGGEWDRTNETMKLVHLAIKNVGDAMCIVPCTMYLFTDDIELDFIHAISFNWEG